MPDGLDAIVTEIEAREPWPDPRSLSSSDDLPAWPIDAMPPWLADFITSLSISTQTAPEMGAAFVLGALAAICGGRVWVEAQRGWVEGLNLYLGVVAGPGERKTPVQRACIAPVLDWERALRSEDRQALAKRRARRESLEADVERARDARRRAKDSRSRDEAENDLSTAREALANEPEPNEVQIIVGDATPEALIEALAAQSGRLAALADEDTMIGHLLGRYTKVPAIEAFLQAYSNSPIRRTRKGKPEICIDRPALTIATPMQPALLEVARANEQIVGRGLLDRFALVAPPSMLGYRDVDAPPISDAALARYRNGILDIAQAVRAAGDVMLRLSPDAEARWKAWRRGLEVALGPAGDLAELKGWASKAEGMCLRIAALLHVAHVGAPVGAVSGEAMAGSIRLVEILAHHATVARELEGAGGVTDDARALAAWLASVGGKAHERDAKRALRRFREDGARFGAAQRRLTERGWTRHRDAERRGERGPVPREIELSPKVGKNGQLGTVGTNPYKRIETFSSLSSDAHSLTPGAGAIGAKFQEFDGYEGRDWSDELDPADGGCRDRGAGETRRSHPPVEQ